MEHIDGMLQVTNKKKEEVKTAKRKTHERSSENFLFLFRC